MLLFITGAFLVIQVDSSSYGFYIDRRLGIDISYPQCGKQVPVSHTFGVIGITGGRTFTKNPCLAEQYSWAKQVKSSPAVYINLSAPTPRTQEHITKGPRDCTAGDRLCQAYNYGFQAAQYAYEHAEDNRVKSHQWWLDIETMNTWDKDVAINAQVIQGAIDSLKLHAQKIGIYSTSYQWKIIAGEFAPGLPLWTAGAKNREHAFTYCDTDNRSFGGGVVTMVQWIENNLDHNILCPQKS